MNASRTLRDDAFQRYFRSLLRMMRVPDPALRCALEAAALHHERWEGHGYAHALVGRAIPLTARMMAIVDCYDVIVSPRPYKSACSHSHACGIIKAEAGSAFDPSLVEIFLSIEHEVELENSAWWRSPRGCVANVEVSPFG
ncbi:HD domain-containing phosphohydrolase [Caballeronia sp. INDeC2]|uniref:HD-GYP domain-containing protein n=1 Tax=Caballeronia sp. INDeC2 TaxID=2921747 RepID=UPI0032ECF8C5